MDTHSFRVIRCCLVMLLAFPGFGCSSGKNVEGNVSASTQTPVRDRGDNVKLPPGSSQEVVNPFQNLHTLIKPHPDEAPWADVPWETSLAEARKKAAALGKPLFVWKANGDPIGCT